jgi:hypothetical protein
VSSVNSASVVTQRSEIAFAAVACAAVVMAAVVHFRSRRSASAPPTEGRASKAQTRASSNPTLMPGDSELI